ESVLAPRWLDDRTLYLISDRSGWWNLYRADVLGTSLEAIHPAQEEFAFPLWFVGGVPYQVLSDGRLAVLHGRQDMRLGVLDPETGELADLGVPYAGWEPALSADGTTVAGIAYQTTAPASLVRVDVATGRVETLRRQVEEPPDVAYLPRPRTVEIESRFGRRVHAIVYPPSNPEVAGEGAPPYTVFVHGGPTGHSTTALDLEKAFFTSRGIGVIDV